MIFKAIDFATSLCRGETCYGTKIPLIRRINNTGAILIDAQMPEKIVTSGILFGTQELVGFSKQSVTNNFGEEIADIIQRCSKFENGISDGENEKSENRPNISEGEKAILLASQLVIVTELDTEISKARTWHYFTHWKTLHTQPLYYADLESELCKGFINTYLENAAEKEIIYRSFSKIYLSAFSKNTQLTNLAIDFHNKVQQVFNDPKSKVDVIANVSMLVHRLIPDKYRERLSIFEVFLVLVKLDRYFHLSEIERMRFHVDIPHIVVHSFRGKLVHQ
ncbi:MAG: HD domain-containing protein, partial [Bacteroidota bacterium]